MTISHYDLGGGKPSSVVGLQRIFSKQVVLGYPPEKGERAKDAAHNN